MTVTHPSTSTRGVHKIPTGIRGFDSLSGGGLPRGRATLVCGSAGCGKTLFAMEFLLHGALKMEERGVVVSFQETAEELIENVAGIGFDCKALVARRMIALEVVRVGRADVSEAAAYDFDGLLQRLQRAITAVGATRIVFDAIEHLFDALPNRRAVRAELTRLLRWLKDQGLTVIVTCEASGGALTRNGLEEYVSDCVIFLDQRVHEQIATRRLRIVKYRGSGHNKDEVPFTIEDGGINITPIASLDLEHDTSAERVSTGVPRLDTMLGGHGVFRGSTVLVSGVAGSGKTSIAAHAIVAACQRGERALYFAFEEGSRQIVRNMRSIGIDLHQWIDSGLLRFHVARPTNFGLERHVLEMERVVESFAPQLVVLDPVSGFDRVGKPREVELMLMRIVDSLKRRGITAVLTSLTHASSADLEGSELGLSSLIDTWLLVQFIQVGGERNRALFVLKSRGMPHSNQIREFIISDRGIELVDVYAGPAGVLTGSARLAQEAKERDDEMERRFEAERRQRELLAQRQILEARIGALQVELAVADEEAKIARLHSAESDADRARDRRDLARLRQADLEEPTGVRGRSPSP